ncbi:MAG: rod shape-determining protein MreC [Clostridia bacterium]|nr:rod shape-determining protein MreC [Clostridia bacterium]
MRDFLKNKFFIAISVAAVLLVAVPSILSAAGAAIPLRNAVNVITTPLQKCFGYITNAVDGFVSYYTKFDDLVSENAALKKENAALRDRLYNAEEIEKTNDYLSRFLEMKRAHTDFTFAEANVIGSGSGNYMTVFTVDRGTAHGIQQGMPVVSDTGVIGYVDEVGLTWAKIRTLIESSSSIGGYIERTGELGLIEGNFDLSAEGLCEITYLAADSDIRVGDRILTSGYGSVYPRDLVIGTVTEIIPDDISRTLTARIAPAATLEDLRKVMIITDYETVTE